MNWVKTSTRIHADGSSEIRYETPDSTYAIESRKRAIPHANGSGVWYHTTYFVIAEDGTKKEFWKLGIAQKYVEAIS